MYTYTATLGDELDETFMASTTADTEQGAKDFFRAQYPESAIRRITSVDDKNMLHVPKRLPRRRRYRG